MVVAVLVVVAKPLDGVVMLAMLDSGNVVADETPEEMPVLVWRERVVA